MSPFPASHVLHTADSAKNSKHTSNTASTSSRLPSISGGIEPKLLGIPAGVLSLVSKHLSASNLANWLLSEMFSSVSSREDFIQRFVAAHTFQTAIDVLLCLDEQRKEKNSDLAGVVFNQLLQYAFPAELLKEDNGSMESCGIELLHDSLLDIHHESILDMFTDKLADYERETKSKVLHSIVAQRKIIHMMGRSAIITCDEINKSRRL